MLRVKIFAFLLFFSTVACASPIPKCHHGDLSRKHHKKAVTKGHPLPPAYIPEGGNNVFEIKTPLYSNFHIGDRPTNPLKKYQIGLKVLLLSATNDEEAEPSLAVARKALEAREIPFEHIYFTEKGEKREVGLSLTNEWGEPKYYAVLLTSSQLSFENIQKDWMSSLNSGEWLALERYEAMYNVRRVSLYTSPTALSFIESLTSSPEGTDARNEGPLSEKFLAQDPALKKGLSLDLNNTYYYPVSKITPKEGYKIEKVVALKKIYPNDYAGISVQFPSGKEELHFFFDQNVWEVYSTVLSNLWVNWLTKGIYVGKRRATINAQVDDFFLATDMWYKSKEDIITRFGKERLVQQDLDFLDHWDKNRDNKIYRITGDDLENLKAQQINLFRPLTKYEGFKIEMAYNGAGADSWFGGIHKDHLFQKAVTVFEEFNWLSHTYTHLNLDHVTYDQTKSELQNNIDFSSLLVRGRKKNHSYQSIVTPQISGLFNPHALSALYDFGIRYVTGDNSRPKLRALNPYDGLWSNQQVNGREGILIIPRHATEIFYNAGLPSQVAMEYNFLFAPEVTKFHHFKDVLELEGRRTVDNLLSYNYAPYMFHQANLRVFPYNGKKESLISLWLHNALNKFRHYSSLPIHSYKMDDLKDLYLERMEREKCGIKAYLIVSNNKPTHLTTDSSSKCKIEVTGLKLSNEGNTLPITQEEYGPDHTLSFTSQPGKQTLIKVAQ